MTMSTFRNPVGPQPASTYWRRRIVVGLGILAVIVIIFLIAVRPGGAKPASTGTDGDSKAASASTDAPAHASDAPVDEGACAPAVVKVAAVTDADEYTAEQQPLLSLTVTNAGTTECTFNAGSDVQEYIITSGEDRIWSSKDCQVDAVAAPVTLKPGVAVPTTPFPWDRTRSDPGTCESADRQQVTGGGATYRLAVVLDGVESSESKPFLLN
jgi:hypothetical protein